MNNLLEVNNVSIEFEMGKDSIKVVNDISFSVSKNEIVALVGESGSGKSVTSLSIMGLLAKNGKVASGEILFENRPLQNMSKKEMCALRGREIAMIFQEPMTALDPLYSVGYQISEVLMLEPGMTKEKAKSITIDLLDQVGITNPELRYSSFPHELSGGMRQRVVIAIALARNPKLIIADEPTTALDVTIQKQILTLLKDLSRKKGISILLITHDLAIVSQYADRVVVMYAGKLMEAGSVAQVMSDPMHPYTKGLIKSIPSYTAKKDEPLYVIPGGIPTASQSAHRGCVFALRCQERGETCLSEMPSFMEVEGSREIACWKAINRFKEASHG